jgi:putative oxidoreductase
MRLRMPQTPPPSNLMITTGRVLLALYFLLPGILKFVAAPMNIGLMSAHGIANPAPLLMVAGVAQVAGAVLLMTGRFVRFNALGFVAYILVINVMLHDFWNFSGMTGAHELQNFIKNLGILAGLLVLAGLSRWRMPSVRGLMMSDARAFGFSHR